MASAENVAAAVKKTADKKKVSIGGDKGAQGAPVKSTGTIDLTDFDSTDDSVEPTSFSYGSIRHPQEDDKPEAKALAQQPQQYNIGTPQDAPAGQGKEELRTRSEAPPRDRNSAAAPGEKRATSIDNITKAEYAKFTTKQNDSASKGSSSNDTAKFGKNTPETSPMVAPVIAIETASTTDKRLQNSQVVQQQRQGSAPALAIDEAQLLQSVEVQMNEMQNEIERLQKTSSMNTNNDKSFQTKQSEQHRNRLSKKQAELAKMQQQLQVLRAGDPGAASDSPSEFLDSTGVHSAAVGSAQHKRDLEHARQVNELQSALIASQQAQISQGDAAASSSFSRATAQGKATPLANKQLSPVAENDDDVLNGAASPAAGRNK